MAANKQRLIALDTETTGIDIFHGTKPYFVTTCDDEWVQKYWEWDVDPYTREPYVPLSELKEIADTLELYDRIVFQNSLFDLGILETLRERWDKSGAKFGYDWQIPWSKVHEVLLSSHMMGSCQRKDLTTLALIYLNINVQPYEDAVKLVTKKALSIVKSVKFRKIHGDWALAKKDRPDMPSAGEACWKADMWVSRAVVKNVPEFLPRWSKALVNDLKPEAAGYWEVGDDPEEHPWQNAVANYANNDSEITLPIHIKHERLLKDKGIWPIYVKRLEVLKVVYDMKRVGVTVNETRLENLSDQYESKIEGYFKKCVRLADQTELKSLGTTNALRKVIFEDFGLVSTKKTSNKKGKGGRVSMDKEVLSKWLEELDPKSKPFHFLTNLKNYRQRSTALSYMKGYTKFGLSTSQDGWFRLCPSLNPVGTKTLRWSSNNPNQQNISKKEGFNLRYCFGPMPGRGWASLDYENIELRIPAYGSGEKELIDLFERYDEAPYYGSVHLLNFSTVYPDIWEDSLSKSCEKTVARYIKDHYKSSWYQRAKNGGFAVQYGAVEVGGGKWSTADKAFGRMGSQSLLKARFTKQEEYNQLWISIANKTGFVETMPDITVCPEHGYPLECSRTQWNKISPTVPLNYHTQGTACWVIFKAMLKVQAFLEEVNAGRDLDQRWFMVMQIHDELVIDFPIESGYEITLGKIRSTMESCGADIKVPLKVGAEVHLENWSTGTALAC